MRWISPYRHSRKTAKIESPVKIIQSSRTPAFRRVRAGECGLGANGTHAALAPLRAAASEARPRKGPSPSLDQRPQAAVQRHMPAVGRENFPICASPPACNWREIAVLLALIGKPWSDRMRLVLQLVARLLVVVVLCLGAATVWATIDAYRSVDRATAASAERVSQALEALYWRELLLRSNRTREHLAAGVRMAHHRDDEADFAGNLRPVRAGGRVREAALRPEQGDRQGSAAAGSPRPCRRCLAITRRSPGRSARAATPQAPSRPSPIRTPRYRWPGSTSWTTSTSRC